MKYVVVLVTVANQQEAKKIAEFLVKGKLAACVNIIERVFSVFSWQGKIEQCPEVLLLIKTRQSLFQKLSAAIKKMHSYSVPEIIALPISAGNPAYLNWVKDSTRA